MKSNILILILIVVFLSFQIVEGSENEYGIVKAWFNGENATVSGSKLKVGEPFEIKVEVISKIDGDITLSLNEPGVTKAYDIISGPSKEDEWLDNMKIGSGWSKTYTWSIVPNGAWKNGNAPINIFVQFFKGNKDKKIQFTIANPYILDEQYSGAVPTPGTTATPEGTPTKAAPFLSVIFMVGALLLAWKWRRDKKMR